MTRDEAALLYGICQQLASVMLLSSFGHKTGEAYYNRAKEPQPGDFVLITFVHKPDPLRVLGWLKRVCGPPGWPTYVLDALDGTEVRWENVQCLAMPFAYPAGGLLMSHEVPDAFKAGRADLLGVMAPDEGPNETEDQPQESP